MTHALLLVLLAPSFLSTAYSQIQSDTIKQDSARSGVPDFAIITDRWRDIQPPPSEFTVNGHWYDPYNQNVLKGDYPIIGQNTFFILTASVDNFVEAIRTPTPSGVSTLDPEHMMTFGNGNRLIVSENLKLSFELYGGQTAYRPREWELKVTAFFNLNYTKLHENNGVNIDVRKGDDRTTTHVAFQELFFEKHLFDVSDRYDFVSIKAGIQRFSSDFRGFVFSDFNLGARLFGSIGSNRLQWNLIYLPLLEKETNSELNTVFDKREQDVFIGNLYIQDFLALGYTTQFSIHYNNDRPSTHYDENGFPVRPSLVGFPREHEIKAYYAGWAGDGHFGLLNITHALYQVFGDDSFNPFANRDIALNAQMAALELSIDDDWMRFKVSGFFASGDSDPEDNIGKGFDAIIDQPFFAGGPFSYWNSQRVGLQGVGLVQKLSFLPSLRSSKLEGQSNFVNPGLLLLNVGYDAEISQKLKAILNINYLRFVDTAVLQNFLNQPRIHKQIGLDYNLGVIYRPFLNNNAIFTFGVAALSPMDGFKDIYETSDVQFSSFASLVFTY